MYKKILLIEDNDDFRNIVKDFLKTQDEDFQIFEASSGELGIVEALRDKPDIILMDIRLPNANGIDTAARIKKYLPSCKIIVLTMFETETFRNVFKSHDISAYLGKSELYDKLMPLIRKIFKEDTLNTGHKNVS